MQHNFKYVIVIFIGMAVISCATDKKLADSKSIITPLSGKVSVSDRSLVYALPLTVLDIVIEAEHIIEKPGPYARFAESLLGLRDVIRNENEYWSVRSVTIRSHEEPDPSEFYVIEASTLFQTNVLELKKAGLILDLNPDSFNAEYQQNQVGNQDPDRLRISDLGADEYFSSSNDTVYKLVSVDTAFIKIPYLVEKKQKLTIEQLAEKAAVRLMELRDGKHLILTGETNVFPQDAASIIEMNRLEKDYTELFTGKTWRETRTFSYQVIPKKNLPDNKMIICNFSETKGPLAAGDNNGTPLAIELIPEAKTKGLTQVTRVPPESNAPRIDRLYYRVPDVVDLKISYGNEAFRASRRLIYQFGEVIQLPSNYLLGK